MFPDWDLPMKRTFQATSKEEVLTVTEAGKYFGLSKDEMKVFVDKHNLTKVRVTRNVFRYLLLKEEVEKLAEAQSNG